MKTFVVDFLQSPITSREVTDEGYLKVQARVARTGIQQYLASELGLTDRNPNSIVNVYRPPDEVFATDSLATYLHKEVTDDHPPAMVSAETYKKYSVGQVISVGDQDGDFVKVELLVKDQKTIDKINAGKAELSAGYYAEYIPEKGTADGIDYEFVQRGIAVNHVALVDKARAGQGARIFDQKGAKIMAKVTLDNNRTVEVEDSAAPLIEDSITRLQQQAADADAKAAKATTDAEEAEAKKDKAEDELEKEKEKTSDAAIAKLVEDRMLICDAAANLVEGFEFKDADGKVKSIDAIKKEVVAKLHPKIDFSDKSAAYINAMFDADMEKAEESEDEEEESKKSANDSLKNLAQDMGGQKATVTDARAVINHRITNAWKGEA